MKTAVKLCGLQSEADVSHLHDLSVQYAGFVLAPSKRRVPINILCKLKEMLPKSVIPVAVTVNPTEQDVAAIVEKAGVTHVQLHGDEDRMWCEKIRQRFGSDIRLIKALPACGKETLHEITAYGETVDVFLIDTYQRDLRGGTGKTFQWTHIPAYQKACGEVGRPLWIAGGLTPDNVRKLITQYRPDGVDVSSGIEQDGVKSAALMKQFVQRVRTG